MDYTDCDINIRRIAEKTCGKVVENQENRCDKNKKIAYVKAKILFGGSTGARTPDLVYVKDAL